MTDIAFREALRTRVGSAERFSAFLDGTPYYVAIDNKCVKCGSGKRRVRDRSCYDCHLRRGGENFARMRAGLSPDTTRSRDSHLDLLDRQQREKRGECLTKSFGSVSVTLWPTGRLEVLFPDGYREPDLAKRDGKHVHYLVGIMPELKEALRWAGWF